jgi:antitoxin (DNA-binding transcriptional repressor) of toxin-antitoxin stability system
VVEEVVTSDYFSTMKVVNVKELKARLSAYLREVGRGETFLITDRNTVVARLGPTSELFAPGGAVPQDVVARLASLGCRPPLRQPRPTDYLRAGSGADLSTQQIDDLLDWVRGDSR